VLFRSDGSWPYGEKPDLAWVDGFHTGYVLDALMTCVGTGLAPDALTALENGLAYYRDNLFLADGTPRYSTRSVYPVETQSAAQGIQTFALASEHDPAFMDDAWRVCDYAMTRLRNPDGTFVFRRGRVLTIRQPHVRWVVAPMLLALARLLARSR
jgi:hypothetical protein